MRRPLRRPFDRASQDQIICRLFTAPFTTLTPTEQAQALALAETYGGQLEVDEQARVYAEGPESLENGPAYYGQILDRLVARFGLTPDVRTAWQATLATPEALDDPRVRQWVLARSVRLSDEIQGYHGARSAIATTAGVAVDAVRSAAHHHALGLAIWRVGEAHYCAMPTRELAVREATMAAAAPLLALHFPDVLARFVRLSPSARRSLLDLAARDEAQAEAAVRRRLRTAGVNQDAFWSAIATAVGNPAGLITKGLATDGTLTRVDAYTVLTLALSPSGTRVLQRPGTLATRAPRPTQPSDHHAAGLVPFTGLQEAGFRSIRNAAKKRKRVQ